MASGFHELQHQMFGLHGQKRYREALELVRNGLREHGKYRSRMTFWIACLESRLGQPDQALDTLTELIAAGGWVSPLKLATDEDLAPLHGRPELKNLVETCEARRLSEQADTRPELVLESPARTNHHPPPLVMALHMNGGDALESRQQWLPATKLGALLALPQGTDLLGPGEFGWSDGAFEQLQQHVETIRRSHSFDSSRIVLGGASRGAAVAVEAAVSGRPAASRGFVAIVGAPPVEKLEPHLVRAREAGIRGLFITGDQDFALQRVRAAFDLLDGAGLAVRLDVLPGLGHLYPAELPRLLHHGLEFVLGETFTNSG